MQLRLNRRQVVSLFFAIIAFNTAELIGALSDYHKAATRLTLFEKGEDEDVVAQLSEQRSDARQSAFNNAVPIALATFMWVYLWKSFKSEKA